jgi:DNA polymerase III subunit beta
MHLTCEKKKFEEAVNACARAINPRSPLPILSHLLLEAHGDQVRLTATDLDVGLSIELEANILENGSITCPARLMQDIVSKFPAGQVELNTLAEGRMQLSCGSSKFELSTLPAEEFPSLPDLDETSSAQLPQSSLKSAIKQVAVAAASSQDESRAVMTGIHLTLEKGSLNLVATDGRRLACVRKLVEVPLIGEEKLSVVVPARALIELSRLINVDGNVSLRVGRSQAFFKFDNYSLHCRLLEGRFPDYTKVVPTQFIRTCRIGRDDFIQGLKRMLVVAQEKRSPNLIRLRFDGDTLQLSANTPDLGSGDEKLPVVYDGDPLTIGFNGKYLVDGLGVLESEEIQFDLQEETKSAVIRPLGDTTYDYVVMPVKLRDIAEDYEREAVSV